MRLRFKIKLIVYFLRLIVWRVLIDVIVWSMGIFFVMVMSCMRFWRFCWVVIFVMWLIVWKMMRLVDVFVRNVVKMKWWLCVSVRRRGELGYFWLVLCGEFRYLWSCVWEGGGVVLLIEKDCNKIVRFWKIINRFLNIINRFLGIVDRFWICIKRFWKYIKRFLKYINRFLKIFIVILIELRGFER